MGGSWPVPAAQDPAVHCPAGGLQEAAIQRASGKGGGAHSAGLKQYDTTGENRVDEIVD